MIRANTTNTNTYIKAVGPVQILAAADAKQRPRVSILAYTGDAMTVRGYSTPVMVDLAGLEIPASFPLLKEHDTSLGGVLGEGKAVVRDGALYVEGTLANTAPATEVLALHKAGVPLQASIGVNPVISREARAGDALNVNGRSVKAKQPIHLVSKGQLREVSIVAIGANFGTSVNIAANSNRKGNMDPIVLNTDNPDDANNPTGQATIKNGQKVAASAVTITPTDGTDADAERTRCAAITAAVSRYPAGGKRVSDVAAKAIAEGWEPSKAELEMLRAERPSAPGAIVARREAGDGQTIEAAMCMTAGLPEKWVGEQFDERTMNEAVSRHYRGYSIHRMLKQVLAEAGRPMDFTRVDNGVIRAAFEADRTIRASGFSTISLPGILSNVGNKFLLAAYQAVPTTWQKICAIADGPNFKPMTRYQLTGKGQYEKVPAGGEIPHISLSEASYGNQIETSGAMIAFTRQMIVNDDLGAFMAIQKILGRMGAISLEKEVFTLWLSNPSSFFHADNGNYMEGSDTALSINALTAAEKLFLEQTDDNGDPVLIAPTVLLVPPALNTTAATITRSTEIRDNTANAKYGTDNPHAGRFTPAVSPWLSNDNITGHSDTGWYLVADPGDVAAIEVAFLNGQQNPTIESGETDFNTLGIQFRAFHDWGVAMRDKRAAVKSKGAA